NHSLPHLQAQALWSLFTIIEASARPAEHREGTSILGSRSRICGMQSHIWNRGQRLMRSGSEFGGRAIPAATPLFLAQLIDALKRWSHKFPRSVDMNPVCEGLTEMHLKHSRSNSMTMNVRNSEASHPNTWRS